MKTGYKGTYDYVCKNQKYEIGNSYELLFEPRIFSCGFHYCQKASNVLLHYQDYIFEFKLLEIEDLSNCTDTYFDSDNYSTNKIRIIREISDKTELLKLLGRYHEFNSDKNVTYWESSDGRWAKYSYNHHGDLYFLEDYNGVKCEFIYNSDRKFLKTKIYENKL